MMLIVVRVITQLALDYHVTRRCRRRRFQHLALHEKIAFVAVVTLGDGELRVTFVEQTQELLSVLYDNLTSVLSLCTSNHVNDVSTLRC